MNEPTRDELARELEAVRAAQPPDPVLPPAASLASALTKRLRWTFALWAVLIVLFLLIWIINGRGN